MWIKVWSVCLLVSLVSAEYLYDSNPYAHFGGYATAYDNYKPTDYKFEYGVSDPHTGDHKSQWEVKENGVVRGAYSLLEPDGTTRVVEYYADDTGFHADVKKIGTAIHEAHYDAGHSLADAHISHSLAYNGYGHGGVTHDYGAPIAAIPKLAAPLPVHAAPIAQVQHIAPVQQVIAPQIHHLGSPIQQDYTPQIYSLPEAHYPVEKQFIPTPYLQEPAPFKLSAPVHYAQPIKVPTPHLVQAPQILKAYAPELIGKAYVEQPQIISKQIISKEYAPEGQIIGKAYVEQPQIISKEYAPEVVQVQKYEVPIQHIPEEYQLQQHQQYVKTLVAPTQEIIKGYPTPEVVYGPVPSAPVAPAKVAVKVQNPFVKFFAPLAKYFAPAPTKVVPIPVAPPTKVVPVAPPQEAYYSAPVAAGKYIDEYAYQGYKPEVVISAPHNYAPSPAYHYNNDY